MFVKNFRNLEDFAKRAKDASEMMSQIEMREFKISEAEGDKPAKLGAEAVARFTATCADSLLICLVGLGTAELTDPDANKAWAAKMNEDYHGQVEAVRNLTPGVKFCEGSVGVV